MSATRFGARMITQIAWLALKRRHTAHRCLGRARLPIAQRTPACPARVMTKNVRPMTDPIPNNGARARAVRRGVAAHRQYQQSDAAAAGRIAGGAGARLQPLPLPGHQLTARSIASGSHPLRLSSGCGLGGLRLTGLTQCRLQHFLNRFCAALPRMH